MRTRGHPVVEWGFMPLPYQLKTEVFLLEKPFALFSVGKREDRHEANLLIAFKEKGTKGQRSCSVEPKAASVSSQAVAWLP